MLKLLKFEFRRILKNPLFWILSGFCLLWPIISALFFRFIFSFEFGAEDFNEFLDNDSIRGMTWTIAGAFVTEIPKYVALFTCIHLGRDYTDGIIRNKIIAGHPRFTIYCSYLLTQMTASVFFCVIYILSGLLGMLISGFGVNLHNGEMFSRFGTSIVVFLLFSLIFSVLSLLFRKRALPIILCILIAFISNGAGSVIGSYNLPGKAVDDYIELRHERYEEMVENGILTDEQVEDLEEKYGKKYYLGTPWKIFHPVYVLTPLGFEADYASGGMTMLGSGDYPNELDFSKEFAIDGEYSFTDFFTDLFSEYDTGDQSGITAKDLRHVDSMHKSFTVLNWTYIGKSLIWMVIIGGYGFIVFRKKNFY